MGATDPSFDASNNRMRARQVWSYHPSGNTTADANGRTFTYDAENKQVSVSDSNGTIGEYSYAGDGKRVKKVVPATGETTIFVYDSGGNLVAEYSTVLASTNDAKVNYLTSDHLGSPRINTDANGNIISRHDYLPFGEEIDGTGGRTTGLNYGDDSVRKQFTGYERDSETDLDFAQARFYACILGRFQSADPVAFESDRLTDPQKINLYVYVRNNPLLLIDPSGETIDDSSLANNEKYQAWKKAFLATDAGRTLWKRYDNDQSFTLVINLDSKKDNGARTHDFKFKDGKLVGATISLGPDIGDRNDAANRDSTQYPLNSELGKEKVDTNLLAAATIAHEFGHVGDAANNPAAFEALQNYEDALALRSAQVGGLAAITDSQVLAKRQTFLRLFNAKDVKEVARRNDKIAETAAIEVVQQSLANNHKTIPKGVQNAIDYLNGKRSRP